MKKSILLFATALFAACVTMVGCSDDESTSELPVFDKVTLSKTTAAPGDTITATVTFSYQGSYVNGTYTYSTIPALVTGSFPCGSSSASATFKFIIPASIADDEEAEPETTYTLTVRPQTMAAYAGKAPFIDPAPMGTVTTTFKVLK